LINNSIVALGMCSSKSKANVNYFCWIYAMYFYKL